MMSIATEARRISRVILLPLNLSAGPSGESQNAFQERVAKVITDYTKGDSNVNNFRAKLMEFNIPIDAKVDAMIRKHESGDF